MDIIQQNTDKLLQFIAEKYQGDHLNNNSLVKVIELCGTYLNLKPIEGNSGDIVLLFGTQFIIDNE